MHYELCIMHYAFYFTIAVLIQPPPHCARQPPERGHEGLADFLSGVAPVPVGASLAAAGAAAFSGFFGTDLGGHDPDDNSEHCESNKNSRQIHGNTSM